jgi:SAM-dependent methyltransferase
VRSPVALAWAEPFARAATRAHRRVLEVGCGDGALAERLARAGHDVTAIDPDLSGLAPSVRRSPARFVEVDLLRYDAAPFDAIVLEASLHHIAPLETAAARLRSLLVPGGALAVDDFDRAACDEVTAAWIYRREALLAGRGLLASGPSSGGDEGDGGDDGGEPALARWRREHEHEPPLHTGAELLDAIRSRFRAVRSERVPYLFRYAAEALPRTAEGERAARRLLADERRAIAARRIQPIGLRVVARR